MKNYDFDFQYSNYKYIIGIDEAGRGPLAGPVVSSAVILDFKNPIKGLDDSKKLSHKKRFELFHKIIDNSIKIGIGIILPDVIDKINIYNATVLSMQKALDNLNIYDNAIVIVDGLKFNYKSYEVVKVIKGDTKSASIMAASIIAKVTRDRLMEYYSVIYPDYMFSKHKGYPTKMHVDIIKKFGISPIHRKSFEPIKSIIQNF
ncbi:MAG TPA: ribonuclease HII [Spirochaetota bacterium]|mgnify:CR=1 FL=1|nr:ribonuclease HII [Spirochaetota bacterium]HOM38633.1 ribonuclease HII [Spirochaetota bacterium]HPQ49770.1 ribonuclease HII [Spirochaetota bacterium]